MALPRPAPGNTAATLNSINALCDALDAATDLLATLRQGLVDVQAGKATTDDVARVQANLQQASKDIYAAIAAESDRRTIGTNDLYAAIAAEDDRRKATESGLYAAIAVEQKVRYDADTIVSDNFTAADAQEREAREAAVTDLTSKIVDGLAAAEAGTQRLTSVVDARRYEFLQESDRPGDAPGRFTFATTIKDLDKSDPTLVGLTPSLVMSGSSGSICRIAGSGIVAERARVAVELGRLYRARIVVQRRVNASDPSNDAVRAAIVWLDQAGNVLPAGLSYTVLREWPALNVGNGRVEVVVNFARLPGENVDIVAPPQARYRRIIAWTFGSDAATDIEVLGATDVSDGYLMDPVSADLAARVSALDDQELDPRLSAVEQRLDAPNSLTFASRGDAQAATVPATVTTLSLRGGAQTGDGHDGLFGRVADLPAGGDGFVSHDGARWLRIVPAPDLMTALLKPWVDSLPTEPPANGGPWRNGDGLSWS